MWASSSMDSSRRVVATTFRGSHLPSLLWVLSETLAEHTKLGISLTCISLSTSLLFSFGMHAKYHLPSHTAQSVYAHPSPYLQKSNYPKVKLGLAVLLATAKRQRQAANAGMDEMPSDLVASEGCQCPSWVLSFS